MFNNTKILSTNRQAIASESINNSFKQIKELHLTEDQLRKAIELESLEVYSDDKLLLFRNDLSKAILSDSFKPEDIAKARKRHQQVGQAGSYR